MIQVDKTFELVKSMTKSEKRYFKIASELFRSNNLSVKLFDQLDKMQSYNDVVFYESLKSYGSKNKISSVKSQLFYSILKSLREFHYKKKKRFEVKNLIDFADILFEKGLFEQCRKLLDKAERIADENDYIILLDELTILQNRLAYIEGNVSQLETQLIKQSTKYSKARISNQRIAVLEKLFTEIKLIWVKGHRSVQDTNRIEIERIINHDFMRAEFERETVEETYYYHLIRGYYFYLKGEGDLCIYHKREVLRISSDEFYKVCDSPRIWLTNAKSYLAALGHFGTLEEFELSSDEVQEQLKHMPFSITSQSFVDNVRILIYENKLNLLFLKRDFEKAAILAAEHEDFILEISETVEKNDEMAMYYNQFYAFFFNNDFKRALKWLNKLLNGQFGQTRMDIQIYGRILNIFLHFELGNYDMIPGLHRRTKRFIEAERRTNVYENLLLDIADKLLVQELTASNKRKLVKYLPKVKTLLGESSGKRLLNYFDAEYWLEQKISS